MVINENEHSVTEDCCERCFLLFPIKNRGCLNTIGSKVENGTNVHHSEDNDTGVG